MFSLILPPRKRFWMKIFPFFFSVEKTAKLVSAADVDIMASDRRLTDRDISIVASELGVAWRVLGLRLNFHPATLDAIAESATGLAADGAHKQVRADA
jgi:hypothetical protein